MRQCLLVKCHWKPGNLSFSEAEIWNTGDKLLIFCHLSSTTQSTNTAGWIFCRSHLAWFMTLSIDTFWKSKEQHFASLWFLFQAVFGQPGADAVLSSLQHWQNYLQEFATMLGFWKKEKLRAYLSKTLYAYYVNIINVACSIEVITLFPLIFSPIFCLLWDIE